MTLNLTLEHLAGFFIMAYFATHFVGGMRLIRLLGWIALWQLLTPLRPTWQDLPMMLAAWALSELAYSKVGKRAV
jgi:hypothetical protein